MNKKLRGLLYGVFVIGFFIYTFWDALKFSNRPRPIPQETWRAQFIRGTIKNNPILSLVDSAIALKISTEIYDRLEKRLGFEKLVEFDKAMATGDTSFNRITQPILDSIMEEHKKELFFARATYLFAQKFIAAGNDKKKSLAFSRCWCEYLIAKYNFSEDHIIPDSIIRRDTSQMRNCMQATGFKPVKKGP